MKSKDIPTRGREASKGVLVVCGCDSRYTPVVVAYIRYLEELGRSCDLVEYREFKRWRFLFKAIISAANRKYKKLVFVNVQALPFLLLASAFRSVGLVYWKLECTEPSQGLGITSLLPLLEHLLPKSKVSLVLPNEDRAEIQRPVFPGTWVIPNAPLHVLKSTKKGPMNVRNNRIILYGNLDRGGGLFLKQWYDLAEELPTCCGTSVIFWGTTKKSRRNVVAVPRTSHEELVKFLLEGGIDYSIIGYEPLSVNTLHAAPNKFVESLACGIPTIVHAGNPWLTRVVMEFNCGFVMDFYSLCSFRLKENMALYESHREGAERAASRMILGETILGSPLQSL